MHGPHHVAQKSIRIGFSDFNTSASKFAVVISFLSIDKENRHSVSALINYTKNTVCNTHKETLLSNDIFAIIIALFPVILLISCFMIFYIDPLRAAENALNDAFDELDSLF